MTEGPRWIPIVRRAFTPEGFPEYLKALKMGAWHPKFIVLHASGAPTIKQWLSGPPWQQRLDNIAAGYKKLGWHAGPHLFIAPDGMICVFTPLTVPGIHSFDWNPLSWGVEIVGNMRTEPFDGATKSLTIAALAALHKFGSLDPDGLRLHKENPTTTHKDCPGPNVVKADVIKAVKEAMK